MTQERLGNLWAAISPVNYREQFLSAECAGRDKRVLVVYADYDLTFPREYSLPVVDAFRRDGVNFESRVLPCGHYTTGETPFKYIDGWYMGSFVYRAFSELRKKKARPAASAVDSSLSAAKEDEAETLLR